MSGCAATRRARGRGHERGRAGGCPARPRRCTTARDRGAASVWLLAAGFVLVLTALVGAAMGAATTARHRAQSAADLGALAGAMRAVEGDAAACEAARRIVAANGARLVYCGVNGLDVTVTADAPAAALRRTAAATARAGPVRAPDHSGH